MSYFSRLREQLRICHPEEAETCAPSAGVPTKSLACFAEAPSESEGEAEGWHPASHRF
jgi:hypothetical protein